MEVDLSQLPFEVAKKMDEIFRGDAELKILKAIERQTQTARARRDNVRWDADMNPTREIDPVIDAHWRSVYGRNYTENPDLMRFLDRRNPEIVMKARSPKIMVGYTGRRGTCGRVRFAPGTLRLAA